MKHFDYRVAIIYEHPEWHSPLFEALEQRGTSFTTIDLKKGAFQGNQIPPAGVYYNMVSPSAYVRNNQQAIPLANALCRSLEYEGIHVLNGSRSMALELSKSSQIALLRSIGVDHPASFVFNDVESLKEYESSLKFPMMLKPEQGGSGARMYKINSLEEVEILLSQKPDLWLPDHLLLLQEFFEYEKTFGIVRLEFVGGEFLYAMRVVTNGAFNLCQTAAQWRGVGLNLR